MVTKAERKAAIQAEIDKVCDDVEYEHRPSVFQFEAFGAYVDWEDGCDPDGYFLGRCMIVDDHIARYNFCKGVLRCDPDEDRLSCHDGQGTISLIGALQRRG